MKALCLQLSLALCAILSVSNLSAQLDITCPDPNPTVITCLEDRPPLEGSATGFLSLEGASISGVTGTLVVDYFEFIGEESGCTGDGQPVQRTFRFTDDATDGSIMCNIRFTVIRDLGVDSIACEDIVVNLDDTGNASITEADLIVTPSLQCPGDITIAEIQRTDFSCTDIGGQVVTNEVTAITECNEELNCSFVVTVADGEAPAIDCPDNILVETAACVCEAEVVFADASATDNCSAIVTRVDATGLNSGDLFPGGLTVITFQAEDPAGNTESCNLQVRVNSADPGSIACKGNQNISLDQTCSAKITPEMVVDEAQCDIGTYRITLYDAQGNLLPDDTIRAEFVGEIVTARATYECYDNFCELSFNVEDKMPPMMNCDDMTISCSELIVFPLPDVSDNCGDFEVVLLNQKLEDVSCDGTEIDKIITRTYGVRDASGDVMESCDQRLLIRKFDIQDVEAPALTATVDCGSDYDVDENGNPDPSVTGAPSLGGIDLYPASEILCNVGLTYDDMILNGGTQCGRTLLRTWTVINWYCSEDGMVTFKQAISVVDTTAPVLTIPEDVTISSASSSCETAYTIPAPAMSDNCQDDLQLDIFYPGGVDFDTNSLDVDLGLGANIISYRLSDQCGNMIMESYTVTVEDNIEPVAICESGMSFSLDGNGMAILTAQRFDNGSIDACSDATVEIARMTDACGVDGNTEFGTSVVLCCEDIGSDLNVILRVSDDAGNSNSCMTSIRVTDETAPSFFMELPDITVSNDFLVDTSDLTPFGFVEQNVDFPMEITIVADSVRFSGANVNAIVMDNCSVNQVVEAVVVDINMCQTGTITRSFIVGDGSGTADTITQLITVIAEREFTRGEITFPEDITITNTCPPDLSPLTLGSFPEYDDTFSSMVSHTKEDDTLTYSSPGCFTLERIWFVSDWCNRPDGLTFATYIDTQEITVIDNIAPEITSELQDTLICSFVADCGDHPVDISATATDNCTPADSLDWTFTIAYADGRPDSVGVGNNFSGSLPVGGNTVSWIVSDGCGLSDEGSFTFTIESCLDPVPVCRLGQEIFITSQDTSDNGIDDPVNIATIDAADIDGGSTHPCGKDVTVAFSTDANDTQRVFSCDDLGSQPLMLHAIDEDGRSDFCNFSIMVRDTSSEMLCGPAMVAGVIFGNEVDFIKDVNVTLQGSDLITITDEQGAFAFPEMPPGGTYQVLPSKEDVALNGVSTIDLVMIQRHILGLERFESPYKILAADVNESANVSAADLITLRKLLLGIVDELPSGETWKFIPGDFVFPDPSDPWAGEIPKAHEIYGLSGHEELDFIGVKLGDVNQTAELRSNATFAYKIEGSKIHISSDKEVEFAGAYLEMKLPGRNLELINIENHAYSLVENHSLTGDGVLRVLLTAPEDEAFNSGQAILSLDFSALLLESEVRVMMEGSERTDLAYENGRSGNIDFRKISMDYSVTLGQNIPNPWVDRTYFEIVMPSSEMVQLRVMDISGAVVMSKKEFLSEGLNTVEIGHDELPVTGGMFFYEMSSSYGVQSRKMMLIRN